MTNLNKPTSTSIPPITLTLIDGTEHTAKITVGDLAKVDVLRARKGWPSRDEAQMLWLAAAAWMSLRRVGAAVPKTVDEFIDELDELEMPEDDDTDERADDEL